MNHVRSVVAILLALTIASCQETKEEVTTPLSEKDLYKEIGEEIPYDVGMEWIEFYKRNRYQQGRTEVLPSYSFSAVQFEASLASATDLVGVAFHHGIDDLGVHHIIAIPIDESMSLWSANSGRILLDANSGTTVARETAMVWAQNYKDANPNATWFHFFGAGVFNHMQALPFFDRVIIQPAINVLNLTPQLLLIVMNDGLTSFGRTAHAPGIVYDASNACPPCAVK